MKCDATVTNKQPVYDSVGKSLWASVHHYISILSRKWCSNFYSLLCNMERNLTYHGSCTEQKYTNYGILRYVIYKDIIMGEQPRRQKYFNTNKFNYLLGTWWTAVRAELCVSVKLVWKVVSLREGTSLQWSLFTLLHGPWS